MSDSGSYTPYDESDNKVSTAHDGESKQPSHPPCLLMKCDGTHHSHATAWGELLDDFVASCSAEYVRNAASTYDESTLEEYKLTKESSVEDVFKVYLSDYERTAASPFSNGTESVSEWMTRIDQFVNEFIGDLFIVTYVLTPKNDKLAEILDDEMSALKYRQENNLIYITYRDLLEHPDGGHVYELSPPIIKKKRSTSVGWSYLKNLTPAERREERRRARAERSPSPTMSELRMMKYDEVAKNKLHLYKVVHTTNMYNDAIRYAYMGEFTTEETITFKYLRDNYDLSFDFSFSYDDSNGINECSNASPKKLEKEGTVLNIDELDDEYLSQLINYLVDGFQANH